MVKERTSELERAYNSLKESERGLAEDQRMAHIGNMDWNLVTGEVYWSDELFRIFRRNPQESGATYDEFLSYVHSNDQNIVDDATKKASCGKPIAGDFTIILANGEERKVNSHIEVIRNEKNIPFRMKGTFQDITERKKSEEKLRESEEKYSNIVETANEGIITIDAEARVTYANKKMTDMLGYSLEEGIGRPIWDFISEEGKAIVKLNMDKWLHGINESYELKLIHKDGLPLWVLINAKLFFEKDGKFMGAMSMLTDITKRKEAEEALANIEIARQKEIHHRIKNNLQVISSLLDLQADKFRNRKNIKDSEVLEAFKESQDRVISIALIHEELHRGEGYNKLNFSQYIEELSENLSHTYSLGKENIVLTLNLEDNVFFDMDVAVPLGMIINELVSNSFKHAFVGRSEGEIQIKLHREAIGSYFKSFNEKSTTSTFSLKISDNGVGIPANLDIEALDSLGLQLVTSLVSQLDGELEIKRNKGSEFIIRFKVTENNKLVSEQAPKQLIHQ